MVRKVETLAQKSTLYAVVDQLFMRTTRETKRGFALQNIHAHTLTHTPSLDPVFYLNTGPRVTGTRVTSIVNRAISA